MTRTRRVRSWVIASFLLLWLPAGAAASDAETIERFEKLAFDATSSGRYASALDPLTKAITAALDLAADTGTSDDDRREGAATAEALLLYFDLVLRRADAFDRGARQIETWLERDLPPLFEARARFEHARYRAAAGEGFDGWQLVDELGFLTDWQLIGPFDNEQGSGFDRTVLDPAGPVDLEAVLRGKDQRDASWRRIPSRKSGFVPLTSLFHPATQCMAYAATTVDMPADTAVAFRVGSDEGIRLWVNGREVLRREVRRSCELDQDTVGIVLPEGRSLIVAKVTQLTGNWGFGIRLTDPAGRPLEIGSHDASAEALAGPFASPGEATIVATEGGALELFRQRLDDSDDAALHRRAALFHLLLGADDPSDRTARRHALRAVELAPDDAHARFALALASSLPIKMRPELEENERREHLLATIRLDPSHAEAALELARHYFDSIEIPDRAIAYCEQALAVNPEYLEAKIVRANALAAKQLGGLANAEIEGLRDPAYGTRIDAYTTRARQADRMDRVGDAIELAEAALRMDQASTSTRELLLSLCERAGRLDRAIEILDESLANVPMGVALLATRARVRKIGRDLDGARADLESAIALNPQNPSLWKSYAVVLHELERDESAIEAFEEARALDPKDRWLEGYLEFLKSETRPFEESFPFDLEPLLTEARDWDTDEDNAYRYLLNRRLVKVNPDGTASRYHHLVIEVLNQTGASRLAAYPIGYLPESQRIRLRRAEVTKTDGSVLTGEQARGPQPGVRVVAMPVLEAGERSESALRLDDIRPSLFGDYFGMMGYMHRPDGAPVLRSRLVLITPEGRDFHIRERNGVPGAEFRSADEPETVARVWEMRDLPRVEPEPYMPPRYEFAPMVEVTTYGSWDEFSRWWWSLIKDEFQVSEPMEELIEEIRAEAETTADKVRLVYNFVTTQIRYVAWEFGIHGYQPYTATTIFARRFGDCKDKSILMSTLLDRLGVDSQPVLIRNQNLRGEQDISNPLLNHFNHCILYVPGVDPADPDADASEAPGVYLDGTAQFYDWTTLPASDQGASVVIVDGDTSRVSVTPEASSESTLLEIDELVTLHPNGSATVRGSITAVGDSAAQLRNMHVNPGNRKEQVARRFTGTFGPVDVRSVEFSDLSNLDERVRYEYEVEIPNMLKRAGNDYTVPVFFSAPSLSDFTELPERRYDLLLPTRNAWSSTVQFVIEAPLRGRLYFEDEKIETEFGSFVRKVERSGNVITVSGDYRCDTRRVAVEDYEAFRTFARQVDQAAREVIRIQ